MIDSTLQLLIPLPIGEQTVTLGLLLDIGLPPPTQISDNIKLSELSDGSDFNLNERFCQDVKIKFFKKLEKVGLNAN